MKGLVIWAHSYCRSVLAFYRGLGKEFDVPLKLCVWKKNATLRTSVGFSEDEFDDMDITFIGDDYELGRNILAKNKYAHHIFGAYQSVELYRKLIVEAKAMGCHVGIASEAPCNMAFGYKRYLKECYIRWILPLKVRKQVAASDFVINLSGNDVMGMMHIGWPKVKIISCGYYSPKLEGAHLVKRTETNWKNFSILLSGIHQWHRSPMLLLEALRILKGKGLTPSCFITQEGPLWAHMKQFADKMNLSNVSFLGFVSMDRLMNLYETCSVYVGAGNYEPWGMRLNDVLQCGAPLIVNKGMGGYHMIEEYGCGLGFNRNDAKGLADALEKLICDEDCYLSIANMAYAAAGSITPEKKSAEITKIIRENYIGWQ